MEVDRPTAVAERESCGALVEVDAQADPAEDTDRAVDQRGVDGETKVSARGSPD